MVKIRDDLLAYEDEAWHELQDRLARLPDDAWLRPQAAAGWSAKDLLAHIACWHAELVHHMECIRMTGNDIPYPELDEFNRRAHDQCAEMTLAEVRAMSGAARHRFREEIAAIAPVAMRPRIVHEIRWAGDLHYRGDATERGHIADVEDLLGVTP